MNKKVAVLILLFTLLQLCILAVFGYTPYPDSNGYIDLATDALSYGELYPVASKINEYEFLWNQGAINMVALSLLLTGSVTPLLVLYALMKGATAWFTYDIARKICGSRTAMIALTLYLLYPANYGECTSVHSELPFMFFALFSLWLSVCRSRHVAAGFLLALANWMRPMGLVFLISLLLYHWLGWRKSLRLIAGYLVTIIIIGSVNYQQKHVFIYQAQTGWMALTDYSTNHSETSLHIRNNCEWDVSQKDSAWQSLFCKWLKEHPIEYFSQMPQKMLNTYVSDNVNLCAFLPNKPQRDYLYEELSMQTLINDFPIFSRIQWLTVLNLFIYYSLLMTAFFSLFHFKKNIILPTSIIIIGTLILLFFGHGEARFHIPFMPFIIILSSYYFINVVKVSIKRKSNENN